MAKTWQDTVMSEEMLEQIERDYLEEDFSVNAIRLGRGHTEDLRLRVAQAQAERAEIMLKEQWKQEGIREVVEFVEKKNLMMFHVDSPWYTEIPFNNSTEWRAKLKSWNIIKQPDKPDGDELDYEFRRQEKK